MSGIGNTRDIGGHPIPRFQHPQNMVGQQSDHSQGRPILPTYSHTWIYSRGKPLASWHSIKRRQEEFLRSREESEELHESLILQHQNHWKEQRLLNANYIVLPNDLNEKNSNPINESFQTDDIKQSETNSKKKKHKKGKKSGESSKKFEDLDFLEKNAGNGEKESETVDESQDNQIQTTKEILASISETQNKLEKEYNERLNKLHKQKEKASQEYLKREQQLEKDRMEFFVEFEKHLNDFDKKSRNIPNNRALRDRLQYLDRELRRKDQLITEMQLYISELDNQNRYMNNRIAALQQEVTDFHFEKLQLGNQIVEKNNQLAMLVATNPPSCNLQDGFSDTVYYDCQNISGYQPGVNDGNYFNLSNTTLVDIRDRYNGLLGEFPETETNEEVNWTLTMITKIVDYYETLGKCVYEEIAPNKYISTLIFADKSDPAPNKLEGTFAIGNGDTPLEATQCAVQWAYGYIQSCINNCNDSNGNSIPPSATGSVVASPRLPPANFNFNLEALHDTFNDGGDMCAGHPGKNDFDSSEIFESPTSTCSGKSEVNSKNGSVNINVIDGKGNQNTPVCKGQKNGNSKKNASPESSQLTFCNKENENSKDISDGNHSNDDENQHTVSFSPPSVKDENSLGATLTEQG